MEQHKGRQCNCTTSDRQASVRQTLGEMEFERGIWQSGGWVLGIPPPLLPNQPTYTSSSSSTAMDNDLSRVDKFIGMGMVNARDAFGYTALHYAARSGFRDMCSKLINAFAEVDSRTTSGLVTPLQRASTKGNLDVVRLLVGAGADVRLQDSDGKTALHRSVEEGHVGVAAYLLAKDQSLTHIEDNRGKTPRDLAMHLKNQEMLHLFL